MHSIPCFEAQLGSKPDDGAVQIMQMQMQLSMETSNSKNSNQSCSPDRHVAAQYLIAMLCNYSTSLMSADGPATTLNWPPVPHQVSLAPLRALALTSSATSVSSSLPFPSCIWPLKPDA